ncbi:hypothetical protein [Nocardia brasiliensis]|uniref:hypothetical protein n=1 Tax=Nocardia brasiliensis TaxID=37326 RepID=UPI003D90D76C
MDTAAVAPKVGSGRDSSGAPASPSDVRTAHTASAVGAARSSGGVAPAGRSWRVPPVLLVAGGLIALQLLLRGWVAASGYFYWDDLILVGRAGRYPLLSSELLLHNHDGHFMPLAFVVAWVVTQAAPLVWAGPVLVLVLGQLAVSVAVLRMVRLLLGLRWALLVPLVFFLFSPVTLPAFAWWSAALNTLPLQFALAWVIGDALLLLRTGRRRYAVSGIVVLAVALLFFEKSVIVPFVAFAVAALTQYIDRQHGGGRESGRAHYIDGPQQRGGGRESVVLTQHVDGPQQRGGGRESVVLTQHVDGPQQRSDGPQRRVGDGEPAVLEHAGGERRGRRESVVLAQHIDGQQQCVGGQKPAVLAQDVDGEQFGGGRESVVLAQRVDGERRGGGRGAVVCEVARRGKCLWVGSGLVLMCWLAGYLAVVGVSGVHNNPAGMRDWLPNATSLGVVPALAGGPWRWERWLPAAPWADPPGGAVVLAWVVLISVPALSVYTRRGVWPVWVFAVASVLLLQLPVALVRGGPNTAAELMQSLRYFADLGVTFAVVGALLLRASPRRPLPRQFGSRTAIALTALFVVSSLFSTYTFVCSWRPSPTKTYVANVKSALAYWDGVPLLEQEVPWDVLNPLAYPQNLASQVLAPLAAPGTFADSTPRLRMITDTGTVVDAQVWWNRRILPGPDPQCGYRIHGGDPVAVRLDGPMLEHEWTAQLNYLADRDGKLAVAFEHGKPVTVPVRAGLNTVYVRLTGSGAALRISSRTPDLTTCLGVGPVGVASYDN